MSLKRKMLPFLVRAKRLLLLCLFFSIVALVVHQYRDPGMPSRLHGPPSHGIVLLENPKWYLLCADVTSSESNPWCLCYYDSENVPENYPLPKNASIRDMKLVGDLRGRCAMTINAVGRLGNQMSQYAILYGLAKINRRPAFMLPAMADFLSKYFNLTMPILSKDLEDAKNIWTELHLHSWMEDSYTSFNEIYIKITGYPSSWTYFHHVRDEILREFKFSDKVMDGVRKKLTQVRSVRESVTYVGVHVRRGDYVEIMKDQKHQGTVADAEFLKQATGYFRSKYPDCIFLVASDDLDWCKKNMDNSDKDVYFLGNENTKDPIMDMALLASCNHSIITIGRYGFWTAYLAGGETVHLTNFSSPDAPWHSVLRYEKIYLPNWIPIAADQSSIPLAYRSS